MKLTHSIDNEIILGQCDSCGEVVPIDGHLYRSPCGWICQDCRDEANHESYETTDHGASIWPD